MIKVVFRRLSSQHIYKDVVQLPIVLSDHFGCPLHFLFKKTDEPINEQLKAVQSNSFRMYNDILTLGMLSLGELYSVLRRKAAITIYFHLRYYTLVYALFDLVFRRTEMVVIKADIGNLDVHKIFDGSAGRLCRIVLSFFPLHKVIVCFETFTAQEEFRKIYKNVQLQTVVVKNGSDLLYYKKCFPCERRVKEEQKLEICWVGNVLDPNKNYELLHGAVKKFCLRHPNLHVIVKILGSREITDSLTNVGTTNLSIKFLGYVRNRRDLANVYYTSDILALTSLREGSPLCVADALAFNKLVVATPVSSVTEICGKAGFISKSFDISDFVEALEAALLTLENKKFFHCLQFDVNWKENSEDLIRRLDDKLKSTRR